MGCLIKTNHSASTWLFSSTSSTAFCGTGVSTLSTLCTSSISTTFFSFFRRHRKQHPIVMSQMIFSDPAMMKGKVKRALSEGMLMKQPLMPRPRVSPTERAMLVMPLAAERYWLLTTRDTQVCRAGTSICEMQKRPSRKATLRTGLEVAAMSSRKTLEGRWVQIMVAIAPHFSTSLEESTPLMPLMMLQTKSTPPIWSKQSPYLFSQYRERKDWMMKAPPKASRAKRALRVRMVGQLSLWMPVQLTSCLSVTRLAQMSWLIMQQPKNFPMPSNAQMRTTLLVASAGVYPTEQFMKRPAKAAPEACERQPAMLQYPNTLAVFLPIYCLFQVHASTSCERADCSTGMKGPISPPETDITPKMPAMTRTMGLEDSAQHSPVTTLRRAPTIRVLLRPNLSAWVVSTSEMRTSPRTMLDCIQLACVQVSPFPKRFWKKTTASMPQENMRRMRVTNMSTKSLHLRRYSRAISCPTTIMPLDAVRSQARNN